MNISKLSIAVEIDGKAHLVVLPKGTKELALRMLAGLNENNILDVVEAPEGYEFESMDNN